MKLKSTILFCLICLLTGFIAGRGNKEVKTQTKYLQGPTTADTLYIDHPVKEITPAQPLLPVRIDTVYINNTQTILQTVDTAAIIAQYIISRTYAGTFFNNESGQCTYTADVQYNQLQHISYKYTPRTEQQIIKKERIFQPYLSAGYSTNRTFNIGCGLFYHDIGIDYNYNISTYDGQQNYHTLRLKYKL